MDAFHLHRQTKDFPTSTVHFVRYRINIKICMHVHFNGYCLTKRKAFDMHYIQFS